MLNCCHQVKRFANNSPVAEAMWSVDDSLNVARTKWIFTNIHDYMVHYIIFTSYQ